MPAAAAPNAHRALLKPLSPTTPGTATEAAGGVGGRAEQLAAPEAAAEGGGLVLAYEVVEGDWRQLRPVVLGNLWEAAEIVRDLGPGGTRQIKWPFTGTLFQTWILCSTPINAY